VNSSGKWGKRSRKERGGESQEKTVGGPEEKKQKSFKKQQAKNHYAPKKEGIRPTQPGKGEKSRHPKRCYSPCRENLGILQGGKRGPRARQQRGNQKTSKNEKNT